MAFFRTGGLQLSLYYRDHLRSLGNLRLAGLKLSPAGTG
jgi:hypothetical protein